MASLMTSRVIDFDHEPSEREMLTLLRQAIEHEFAATEVTETTRAAATIKGRVRTRWLTPVVSLEGELKVQLQGQQARVMIDAESRINGWFWFMVVMGLAFPVIWLLMIVLYIIQQNAVSRALDQVLERVAFDAGFQGPGQPS